MTRSARVPALLFPVFLILLAASPSAQVTSIAEILNNPDRFLNIEVTVDGHVQAVSPAQEGSPRGSYTLLDAGGPAPLSVRSNDLPPIGQEFAVTGVIIKDPDRESAPLMVELSRKAHRMATTTLTLLIGAGALFLILLIVFIVLLAKPKKMPALKSAPSAPDPWRTTKMTSPGPAGPIPAADLVVDQGPELGKSFSLHQTVTTIGRHGTRRNEVELHDDTVSKEQASIHFDQSLRRFVIVNESATNPTKVNGVAIVVPTLLENGTRLDLGRTVLVFRMK
jgi:hypothetical protein